MKIPALVCYRTIGAFAGWWIALAITLFLVDTTDATLEHLLLQESRLLESDEDADYSWMTGYTIKYENCFPDSNMVTFALCPKDDTCYYKGKKHHHRRRKHHGHASCESGGEYSLDLYTFMDAFTEAQLGAREYACEMIRERCAEDNENTCYENLGMQYCIERDGDDKFELQEWLECKQVDDNVYVGPYCSSDAYSIYLGAFSDADCSVKIDDSVFGDYFDGMELPYTSESIMKSDCAKCKEHGKEKDQNEGDQEDEDSVLEQCEELYYEANKYELDIEIDNPDTSSCTEIEEMVELTDSIIFEDSDPPFYSVLVFCLLFAMLCTCCVLQRCWYPHNQAKFRESLLDQPTQ